MIAVGTSQDLMVVPGIFGGKGGRLWPRIMTFLLGCPPGKRVPTGHDPAGAVEVVTFSDEHSQKVHERYRKTDLSHAVYREDNRAPTGRSGSRRLRECRERRRLFQAGSRSDRQETEPGAKVPADRRSPGERPAPPAVSRPPLRGRPHLRRRRVPRAAARRRAG